MRTKKQMMLARAVGLMAILAGNGWAQPPGGASKTEAWGVHFDVSLEEARREFEARHYEGLERFEYDRFSGVMNCDEARKKAREGATAGPSWPAKCYAFVGDGGLLRFAQNCRIYRFRFTRYEGPRPRDPQHRRNCHNIR